MFSSNRKVDEESVEESFSESEIFSNPSSTTGIGEEYQRYIKKNRKLFSFIKNNEGKIFIHYFPDQEDDYGIFLKNKSLIKILIKAGFKNRCKAYISTSVIAPEIETEEMMDIVDRTDEKYKNLLDYKNVFHVIKENSNDLSLEKKMEIQIPVKKKSFERIFYLMDESYEELLNYMLVILIDEAIPRNRKINSLINKYLYLVKNKIYFYIKMNKNKKLMIPIIYYSLQKIMKMFNKDNAESNIDYIYAINEKNNKINENKKIKNFENNNKNYLKKLKEGTDNIIINKNLEIIEDSVIDWLEKDESHQMFNLPEIKHDIQVNEIKKALNKIEEIKNLINNKKKEIKNDCSKINNQFIEIKDKNNKKCFVNVKNIQLVNQYLKNVSDNEGQNILLKDFNNKDVISTKTNLEYLIKKFNDDKIVVLLKDDNKNNNKCHFVNKNKILNLYKKWKCLNKKEKILTEDEKKEEIEINLNETKISEFKEIYELPDQTDLLEEIKNENNYQKNNKNDEQYKKNDKKNSTKLINNIREDKKIIKKMLSDFEDDKISFKSTRSVCPFPGIDYYKRILKMKTNISIRRVIKIIKIDKNEK